MRQRSPSVQGAVSALQGLKGQKQGQGQAAGTESAWKPRAGDAVRILSMGRATGKARLVYTCLLHAAAVVRTMLSHCWLQHALLMSAAERSCPAT